MISSKLRSIFLGANKRCTEEWKEGKGERKKILEYVAHPISRRIPMELKSSVVTRRSEGNKL